MKKYLSIFTAYALALTVFSAPMVAYGACTNTDYFCYESGPYSNLIQQARLDASGNLTLNGITTFSGAGTNTFSGSQIIAGKIITTPVVTVVSSFTVITPATNVVILLSTSGIINMAGLSQFYPVIATATATNGQWLTLLSSSPVSTVVLSSGTASALHLGASTRLIGLNSVLQLIYNGALSMWEEVSYVAGN